VAQVPAQTGDGPCDRQVGAGRLFRCDIRPLRGALAFLPQGWNVETDGPDGKLAEFEIKYTFGIDPLRQYLVGFPDGRLQALSIAWDSRPQE